MTKPQYIVYFKMIDHKDKEHWVEVCKMRTFKQIATMMNVSPAVVSDIYHGEQIDDVYHWVKIEDNE